MVPYSISWPGFGHRDQRHLLENAIMRSVFSHAYIFYGAPGLGKQSIADFFVKAVLCSDKGIKPCQKCKHCKAYQKKRHPDLLRLQTSDEMTSISIEQIRNFKSQMQLRPVWSDRRVGIIPHAELLSKTAANGLLKMLEDPYQDTIIILICDSIQALPATIISRNQLVKFSRATKQELKKWLDEQFIEKKLQDIVLDVARGRMTYARSMLEDSAQSYKNDLEKVIELLDRKGYDKIKFVEQLFNDIKSEKPEIKQYEIAKKLSSMFELIEAVIRDLILLKLKQETITHVYMRAKLITLTEKYTLHLLYQMLRSIEDFRHATRLHINTQLSWEYFFLKTKYA